MLPVFDVIRNILHNRYFSETGSNETVSSLGNFPRLFPLCLMSYSTLHDLAGFDENFYFGEDIDFTFKALLEGKKFCLAKDLSYNHLGSYSVGKRETKSSRERALHEHREMVAHRMIWEKYKPDYDRLINLANLNIYYA